MGLLEQLREAMRNQTHIEAQRIALRIEESDYPDSLKQAAREVLLELGRQRFISANPHNDNLYKAVTEDAVERENQIPSWLPWKIILDYISQNAIYSDLKYAPTRAIETYIQSYLNNGINTLHYIRQINTETIKATISSCFDHEYYTKSHPDMFEVNRDDALNHYVVYGGLEDDRKPNRLFSNKDIFQSRPWFKQLNINALYLIMRWPEEFREIRSLIESRYCLAKAELLLPWTRPIASASNQSVKPLSLEYQSVLAITRESSDKERLIAVDPNRLNIHIVIPDFTEGGGGHMTIFRMILNFEEAGHKCTVWVANYAHCNHLEGPRISAVTHYQPIKAQVLPLSAHFAFARGDALIATSWETVEIVCANKSFHDYFYLVQDYEPYFYPRGSEALEAELTYKADIKTICASSWLDNIMRTKFNRTSIDFDLSYDPSIYSPPRSPLANECRNGKGLNNVHSSNNPIIRVAFYARSRTDRRAVALALKGLEKLKQLDYTICIELFGESQGNTTLPINVIGYDNGILTSRELADLYRSCDIGLTFSATNYSLVPQEMMACGLPVVEIDNDSTRAIYPEGTLILAEPSPTGIADAIDELARDRERRKTIATNGFKWVQKTSWKNSFQKVENFIRNEVMERSSLNTFPRNITEIYQNQQRECIHFSSTDNSIVSIVIPTYQGGHLLQEVVKNVQSQALHGHFEIIIIDSGSTDTSIDGIPRYANISIYQIAKREFQHGRTRNLGVALASSPFVAFLTQDAIPVGNEWLANLILPFQENSEVDAVFGRHSAHPGHPKYLNTEMEAHFNNFKTRKIQRKSDALKTYYQENPSYRQFLHFYSDNNSCLRKASWESYPYPDVSYGEDQLWADWIIQNDGVKVYADDALVYHSHDYSEIEEYERSKTEAFFFLKYFGYELAQNRLDLESDIEKEAKSILSSGRKDTLPHKKHLLELLRAKREGYNEGSKEFRLWLAAH